MLVLSFPTNIFVKDPHSLVCPLEGFSLCTKLTQNTFPDIMDTVVLKNDAALTNIPWRKKVDINLFHLPDLLRVFGFNGKS